MEGTESQEEAGAVPGDEVEAFKAFCVGDLGDGGCDDGHVEGDEEDAQGECDDDGSHAEASRIDHIGCGLIGGQVILKGGGLAVAGRAIGGGLGHCLHLLVADHGGR